jgi:hypothetical protein
MEGFRVVETETEEQLGGLQRSSCVTQTREQTYTNDTIFFLQM